MDPIEQMNFSWSSSLATPPFTSGFKCHSVKLNTSKEKECVSHGKFFLTKNFIYLNIIKEDMESVDFLHA